MHILSEHALQKGYRPESLSPWRGGESAIKKKKRFHVRSFIRRAWEAFRRQPVKFSVYLTLRLLVIGVLISQLLEGNLYNAMECVLTLVLFMLPSFVEHRIKIDLPDTLEIIVLILIFASVILGEIQEYFVNVRGWDTMLHTVNGFLAGAIGIALIDILNRTERLQFKMSPAFVALTAFCFSMTVGVVWEFYEYGMDCIFRRDMQKDTVVDTISSVALNPEGRNRAVVVTDIKESVIYGKVNGQETKIVLNGYLDIGIHDTMKDLLVNFIGAIIMSMFGYIHIKHRGKGPGSEFLKNLMPTIPGSDGLKPPDGPP